jgi:hypothetical protein
MVAPITLTVVTEDGRSATGKIEVAAEGDAAVRFHGSKLQS